MIHYVRTQSDATNAKDWKRSLWPLSFLVLLPGIVLLKGWAQQHHAWVEQIYTRQIFAVMARVGAFLSSWTPFSIAEGLLCFLLIGFVVATVWWVIRIVREKHKLQCLASGLSRLVAFVCIAYALFYGLWGMNYDRLTVAENEGYAITNTSTAELTQLCEEIIRSANELAVQRPANDQGIFDIGDVSSLLKAVDGAYAALQDPSIPEIHAQPKRVIGSRTMSYIGVMGIYSPFTFEANINCDIPAIDLPHTACHEAAHLRGFAREDEANYIGIIACRASGDIRLRYAGEVYALRETLSALGAKDSDVSRQLWKTVHPIILKDLEDGRIYWKSFEGKANEIQREVNDAYLKSNGQSDGVYSYGRVVDLLLAQRRARFGAQGF